MIRKPYVIVQHMYSNGVRKSEVAVFNRQGYLTKSVWLRDEERAALQAEPAGAQAVKVSHGSPEAKALVNGEMMFRGQCAACHTTDGYRSMKRLLQGRDHNSIMNLLKTMRENKEDSPYRAFMPPLVGTRQEVDALADYLHGLVSKGGASLESKTAVRR